MVDGLDLHHRFGSHFRTVISRPFAEWSLGTSVGRRDKALDNDFGVSRERQASMLPFNQLHGLATYSANNVVFADVVRDIGRAHQERHRISAQHNHRRHRLAILCPFVAVYATVFAGRDVKPHFVPAMDHHPIRADIDPAGLRISRYVIRPRTDVASTVTFVPNGRGESFDIDIVSLYHVF